jgi:hypothetical protein
VLAPILDSTEVDCGPKCASRGTSTITPILTTTFFAGVRGAQLGRTPVVAGEIAVLPRAFFDVEFADPRRDGSVPRFSSPNRGNA